jgi:hypothetical protein
VGRIRREAAHLGKGRLQPGQHLVQRAGQPAQLIVHLRTLETFRQMLGLDPPGRHGHLVHGSQSTPRQDPAPGPGQYQRQGNQGGQRPQEVLASHGEALQRHAHLQDVYHLAA